MHQIYQHADLTIVAAAGDSSDYGLPGMGSKRRHRQPYAVVGDNLFVSTLPDPSFAIMKSKWMTRAWTYQEAVFSCRLKLFAWRTCWATPVISSNFSFSRWLLWSHAPNATVIRRPEFPSWSWLGWRGGIICLALDGHLIRDGFESASTFSIETSHGNKISLDHRYEYRLFCSINKDVTRSCLSNRLHLVAPLLQPKFVHSNKIRNLMPQTGSKWAICIGSRQHTYTFADFESLDASQSTDSLF